MNFQLILHIALTILFTSVGQILAKHGMTQVGDVPELVKINLNYLIRIFSNPFVLSGLMCGVLAAINWLAALSKLQLSLVYPFMSLTFVLVAILSMIVFHEDITIIRWVGILLIVLGLIFVSQS